MIGFAGAECSVRDPKAPDGDGEIHLLCLRMDRLPKYGGRTPVDKMIERVHDPGGFVVMSNPVQYPESFFRYCHLPDGYEYSNGAYEHHGGNSPFGAGKAHIESIGMNGGYQLTKDSSDISAFDGGKLTEGDLSVSGCLISIPDYGEPCKRLPSINWQI